MLDLTFSLQRKDAPTPTLCSVDLENVVFKGADAGLGQGQEFLALFL